METEFPQKAISHSTDLLRERIPSLGSGKLPCHRILAITETNATAATKDSEKRRRDRQDRAEKAVLGIPTLLASRAQHKSDS